MPYNNAPIEPVNEITGSSNLPLARVKKIIAQDDEIAQCSNSAAFAISVATEIFIRHLTEQAHMVVKSEKKPRRNLAYKDIATAVSRIDNLEFLSDVVPKTKTYRQFREEKAREEAAAAEKASAAKLAGANGESNPNSKPIDQMLQQQDHSVNGHLLNGEPDQTSPHMPSSRPSNLIERTIYQNGHNPSPPQGDIDMSG